MAAEMGTSPGELVRIMFKQLVRRRAIPFPLAAEGNSESDLVNVNRRNEIWRQFDDSEGW